MKLLNYLRPLSILPALAFVIIALPSFAQDDPMDLVYSLQGVVKAGPNEMPETPNPYLSLLPPGVKRDYQAWKRFGQMRSTLNDPNARSLPSHGASAGTDFVDESEPNDTRAEAQKINKFGTKAGKFERVFVNGSFGEGGALNYETAFGEEDDGSILLANITGVTLNEGKIYEGLIGDGPLPGVVSDFDFYQVDVQAGETLIVTVRTPLPFDDLDPFISLWSQFGDLLATNDDAFGDSFDSQFILTFPFSGSFYVAVGGFGAFIPQDPFDSSSPSFFGDIGSEGEYTMEINKTILSDDVDYYAFKLKKGDVFSAGISNLISPVMSVFDPDDELNIQSFFNTSFYPAESPVNRAGASSIYHIAEEDGMYAIAVQGGIGGYELELFVTRSNLEKNGGVQVLFLDYDGAEFDLGEFFGLPFSDVRQLSPFRDFLSNWGISDDPLTTFRLTRKITRVVQENIQRDLRRARINPNFQVIIIGNSGLGGSGGSTPTASAGAVSPYTGFGSNISSLGSFDNLGNFISSIFPVSKVIVGGTIEESGISTIGIAQSIDPGNFATEETALVLMDILSGSVPSSFDLNGIPRAPGTSIEDLVVTAVGNIISHEIGHYLGNWHNDGFDNIQTLMDEGPGGVYNLIGGDPAGEFGDENTIDVDFTTDFYSTLELFNGVENTANQTAWALGSKLFSFHENHIVASELVGTSSARAYPNPVSIEDNVSIDFQLANEGAAKLEIYNLTGQKVATLFDEYAEANRPYTVRFSPSEQNMESGMYLYRLISDGNEDISEKIYFSK